MKMKNVKNFFVLIFISLLFGPLAMAQTTAGTSVTNQASVDYEVGGVAQTPVDSNISDFVVALYD